MGLLFVNGKLERMLEPGAHAFWKFDRTIQTCVTSTRGCRALEVSGQEILSKDKVSLRLNLSASYRVADAETGLHSAVSDFGDVPVQGAPVRSP